MALVTTTTTAERKRGLADVKVNGNEKMYRREGGQASSDKGRERE